MPTAALLEKAEGARMVSELQKMLDDATIDAGRLYIREVDLSVD